MPTYTAAQLAQHLNTDLRGDAALPLSRLCGYEHPEASSVMVIDAPQLHHLRPSPELTSMMLIAPQGQLDKLGQLPPEMVGAYTQVADPRLALAQLSQLFDERPYTLKQALPEAVNQGAVVGPGVYLGEGVRLEPRTTLGANVHIGAHSVIGAGTVIMDGASLGQGCLLYPNVTIYDGVTLGDRVTVHSGAVIGADGFGYAPSPQGTHKIHQLGTVSVGHDVEIGANTCIDRATLAQTYIGPRCKIDNLCQIAHNAYIHSDCIIAGQSAIGGSTVIEQGVMIGGNATVSDHLHIGAGARLIGNSGYTKNVPAGQTWGGFPAKPYKQWVRTHYLLGKLDTIWAFVKGQGTS